MDFRAKHRFAKISPRKARAVADMVRGKDVNRAMIDLDFTPNRGATFIDRVVRSAIANAEHEALEKGVDVDVDRLYVAEIRVDQAQMMKRWMPRAMGRATPIMKRRSHISVVLRERVEDEKDEE